jgi:replicative DNA helicase
MDPREAILSAALFSRNAAQDLCSFLRDEDFTGGQRLVFQAIRDAVSRGEAVDPSGLATALERGGVVDPYKHILPYLDDRDPKTSILLVDPTGRRFVMEHIRTRRVREDVAAMVAERRYEEIPGYISSLNISEEKQSEVFITDGKIGEFLTLIREHRGKKTLGYSTGLSALDEITGGMVRGQVWAIGAPTSSGKTTLLCQFVAEAMRAGAVCLFFSLEMSIPLMYARLAGAFLGINPTAIYRGRITEEQTVQVQGALEVFRDFGLRVYREISDAEEIVRRSREAKIGKGRVDIVAVDFMQNVTVKDARNTLERMSEAARILQGLSGDLNCCTLIASQLSNQGVQDKGAGIFSYRYASELAHAADTGIELVPTTAGPVDLHVRKNRHGATGKIQVKFNEHFSAFVDYESSTPRSKDLWPGY